MTLETEHSRFQSAARPSPTDVTHHHSLQYRHKTFTTEQTDHNIWWSQNWFSLVLLTAVLLIYL